MEGLLEKKSWWLVGNRKLGMKKEGLLENKGGSCMEIENGSCRRRDFWRKGMDAWNKKRKRVMKEGLLEKRGWLPGNRKRVIYTWEMQGKRCRLGR